MPTANNATAATRETPRNALQFRSAFEFAKAPAAAPGAETSEADVVPFTMTARTGDPIDHWFWGRVVHDMAGMQLEKGSIPVDYCHDQCEVIGFADSFDTTSGDLVIGGNLTPMPDDEDDRATEIISKQKRGVPYEASIDFSRGRPVVEFVPEGVAVEVNGQTFGGPLTVIRNWTLSGVAICPYGADSGTSTEFSAAGVEKITVTTIGQSTAEGEATRMSSKPATTTTTTPTAGQPAATPAAATAGNTAPPATTPAAQQLTQEPPAATKPAEIPAAAIAKDGEAAGASSDKPEQKYIAAFGDTGARWFLEKKPFEACAAEFVAQLKQTHAGELDAIKGQFARDKEALETQLAAANAKLTAIGRGDAGVHFSNAEGKNGDAGAAEVKTAATLAPGTARFASGIKLPSSAKK